MKKNKTAAVIFLAATVQSGAVFLLYDVMKEPFIYAQVLLFAVLVLLFGIDFAGELKSARLREDQKTHILFSNSACGETLRDKDYFEMIESLLSEINRMQTDFSVRKQADNDYYTAWVHQIKTPIATMKLLLSENTEEHRTLSAELFRIEQYVEMVLNYIRLESDVSDLLFKEYSLDELIRETLRKFAPQFILRKLKLVYEPTDQVVVTDKKWLTFILEQLISNAIKYTPEGGITISVEGSTVKISDTGIGIAPEDIPRIFEKGYTGTNGRTGLKSSGLGLFLSKKAADLLAVRIDVVSVRTAAGSGSTFSLSFPEHSAVQTKEETKRQQRLSATNP